MSKQNTELWDSVCETDPSITKKVNQRGGFTAIAAQSQLHNATKVFGAFGTGWGVSDERIEQWQSAGLALYQATLWYKVEVHSDLHANEKKEFPIHSSIRYQTGGRVDDDFFKKVATDALTKGLSKLGFNADVFLGKFDDNKYVAKMNKEFKEPTPIEQPSNYGNKESEAAKGNGKALPEKPQEDEQQQAFPGPTPEEVAAKESSSDDSGPSWEEWRDKVFKDLQGIETEEARKNFVGKTKDAYEMCAHENMDIAEAVAKAFADKKAALAA